MPDDASAPRLTWEGKAQALAAAQQRQPRQSSRTAQLLPAGTQRGERRAERLGRDWGTARLQAKPGGL